MAGGAHEARALWDGASPRAVRETGRSRRSPEGVEGRGHAQRASEAPEHRAAVREAKGRLGPGNLEGEARKYAGPYPRAAKGECAGETGEGGAKMQGDYCELWNRSPFAF